MKSGKTIETAQRALEILKDLMIQDMSVEEILDRLSLNESFEMVYTNEVIYKYLNTFKASDIGIQKKGTKYSVTCSPLKIPLTTENLMVLNFLEQCVNASQKPEYKKKFKELKKRIAKNNTAVVTNLNSLNFAQIIKIDKHYQKYAELIQQLESFCISKQKIKIKYQNSKDVDCEYIIVADEIIFDNKQLVLYAYCEQSCEICKFMIEKITSIIPFPLKGCKNFYTKTTIFKLKGALVNNYVLRPDETVKEYGDDFLVIMNNYQNQDDMLQRLLRYGELCEVIYPKVFRNLMKERIEEALAQYES